MNNKYLQATVLIALAAGALFLLSQKKQEPIIVTDFGSCQMAGGEIIQDNPIRCRMPGGQTFDSEENPEPEVVLDMPAYGDLVKSPLTVTGKARGTWFFEANLPVTLKDENGKVLAQVGAQAQSDWMTTDYVPFTATLTFDPGTVQYGVLIIEKDNPSGMPEFDSSFAIPVKFKE